MVQATFAQKMMAPWGATLWDYGKIITNYYNFPYV